MNKLLVIALALALLPACGSDEKAGDDSTPQGYDCASLPKVQGASEACCPEYGFDACGALLFCAAFDERTIPTCYPEHSRLSAQECNKDRHCASQQCNLDELKCKYQFGEKCLPAIGCAESSDPDVLVVCAGTPRLTGLDQSFQECARANGRGGECGLCDNNADCANPNDDVQLVCTAHRCVGPTGANIFDDKCCLNGATGSEDYIGRRRCL